jgi:hypothetical protein
MRVLLRQIRSGFYYAGKRRWVPQPDSARDFHDVRRAFRKLRSRAFAGAEVILTFENPGLRSRFSAFRRNQEALA